MPRRNTWGRQRRQHSKGLKRPRAWHRKHRSAGISKAAAWLDEQQRRAA